MTIQYYVSPTDDTDITKYSGTELYPELPDGRRMSGMLYAPDGTWELWPQGIVEPHPGQPPVGRIQEFYTFTGSAVDVSFNMGRP